MNDFATVNVPERAATTAALLRLGLVTPARNEGDFIEQTIKSVTAQTVLPVKWVIVSDGSTDRTAEIVQKYAEQYHWIECVNMPPRTHRDFAGKVSAFNVGYQRLQESDCDVIGNLDADVTLDDSDYFAFLLGKFGVDPMLGVAGCPFREGTIQYDYRFSRKEHVSGACQLFRRECFEQIGGYIPLKIGAVDLMANVSARMKGWRTETFPEKFCVHHRQMGSAKDHFVGATFKSGYGDYLVGVHPVWQISRSIYQMTRPPLLVGGVLLLAGYLWGMLKRAPKPISNDLVNFRRSEQRKWLREYAGRALGFARSNR